MVNLIGDCSSLILCSQPFGLLRRCAGVEASIAEVATQAHFFRLSLPNGK